MLTRTLLTIATLLFAVPANPADQIITKLDAGHYRRFIVNLKEGDTMIEAFSGDTKSRITCLFRDPSQLDDVVLAQRDVYYCHGKVNLSMPRKVVLEVRNEESHSINLMIFVQQ